MTLPYEEEWAVKKAWLFLFDVMNGKRVPKALKETARGILRHYPGPTSTEITYRNAQLYFKAIQKERGKKTPGEGE